MGRIVVGVDASEGSRRALGWAAEQAAAIDAELEVIHTYDYAPAWRAYAYEESVGHPPTASLQRDLDASAREAGEHAQHLVDRMVADLDHPKITTRVLQSSRPAQTLVEQSDGADLLVVGSRGRGGFAGLLLGSVSQQCVTHASCPVVVVPPAREES
jgi:nucleotide-binding universal stress UspA family protein